MDMYLFFVAPEDDSLDRFDVRGEDFEPVFLPVDLAHVGVDGGDVLVAPLETGIDVAPRGPLARKLQLFYHVATEPLRQQWKPEDVGTGLLNFAGAAVRVVGILRMDVLLLPFLRKIKPGF